MKQDLLISKKDLEEGGKLVTGICAYHCCNEGCLYQAVVKEGKVVRLGLHPRQKHPNCVRAWTYRERLYHEGRLKYPLKRVGARGEGKWQRISWDEALDTVASRLNEIKANYGNESILVYHYVSQLTAPGGMYGMKPTLLRLFNLWGGCIPAYQRGSLCWQAFISAMNYLFGSWKVIYPNEDECDLIIIWASNPAVAWNRGVIQSLLDAKEKGKRFIVVDPVFSESAAVLADQWVPLRPGTDLALALAMIKVVIESNYYNEAFILERTNAPFLVREDTGEFLRQEDLTGEKPREKVAFQAGDTALEGWFKKAVSVSKNFLIWDQVAKSPKPAAAPGTKPALYGTYTVQGIRCRPVWQVLHDGVKEWTPEKASQATRIPPQTILNLAHEFGRTKPAKITADATPAFNRASWGENAVTAVNILNAITGNVYGRLYQWDPRLPILDIGLFKTATLRFDVPNPVAKRVPVSRIGEAILNPKAYDTNIKAAFVMLGNPVSQNPDGNKVIQALKALEFVVVADVFMSATAKYADIVLPVTTLLERTSVFEAQDVGNCAYIRLAHLKPQNYLIYADKSIAPPGEARDDFDIIMELARRWGFQKQFPWKDPNEWISDVLEMAKEDPSLPWLKDVTMEQLQRENFVDVDVPPLTPTWELGTPTGKIELYSEALLKLGYDPIPVYRPPEESREATPELFAKYPIHLVSPKSNFWANSSQANHPTLLELGEPKVLMHPQDAARRGIKDGDLVTVYNDRGQLRLRALVAEETLPGVVRIHQAGYPEERSPNFLNSDRTTTYGETTTYNTCLVQVSREG